MLLQSAHKKNLMKILLINTTPTGQNGITGVIFNYLKAFEKGDIIFDLLSMNIPERSYSDIVESKGGHVYVIPRLNGTFKYWNELRRLVKKNRYDAVHIHGNSHTVVLELLATKVAGCVVRMVHSHTTTCMHVVVSKLLTLPFNLLYTHGLACGEAAGRWMFGKRKFTVINNGVDTCLYSFDDRKRLALRKGMGWENCKVIGHVGSMVKTKNHRFIIEIFKELYKQDETFRLLLIGDGLLRPEIEEIIKKYRLQNIICMTGNINNVSDYLNAMDMVLMPSLFEGLPLTLIEQQANGLRCIVSDVITREADKTGNLTFLPLSMDASKWVTQIKEIIIDNDAERLARSHAAVESIKKKGYCIQVESNKLLDYYIKAVR